MNEWEAKYKALCLIATKEQIEVAERLFAIIANVNESPRSISDIFNAIFEIVRLRQAIETRGVLDSLKDN